MTAQSRIDAQTNLVLRIHILWRGLFALLAAASIVMIWTRTAETPL